MKNNQKRPLTEKDLEIISRTREVRKEKRLTQEEVASLLAMERASYTLYETKMVMPRWRIKKFCEIMNINIEWLLEGTPPKYRAERERIDQAYERLRSLSEQQQKAVESIIDALLESKGT